MADATHVSERDPADIRELDDGRGQVQSRAGDLGGGAPRGPSQARRVWLSAWCVAVPAPIREPGEQYLEGDFTSGTRRLIGGRDLRRVDRVYHGA